MMESKHAIVDKAASINTVERFFDAYRKRDLDRMVAHCNPEGELRYVPLGNQGIDKIGTTGRTIWSGLFYAVPDLTNRMESIFADIEGNVCGRSSSFHIDRFVDNTIITVFDSKKKKRLIIDGQHRASAITIACEKKDKIPKVRVLECYGKSVNLIFPCDVYQL
jgi:hypothetical protein